MPRTETCNTPWSVVLEGKTAVQTQNSEKLLVDAGHDPYVVKANAVRRKHDAVRLEIIRLFRLQQ